MRFEDFDILINKGFWTIQENLIYIAYGTIRGNMQQIHIRRTERGCENGRKLLFKSSIEKIDNLNNVGC